jgi:AraC-like DNA-binding protein/tetratricopeptide (TPR) repeat protein
MPEPLTTDQVFIRKLTDFIQANLSNERLGVKELVHEFNMSQYSLSRRIHSIKRETINQFIREVRLQKALEMLQNGSVTASEVAYNVGFSNPAYFNRCFHEFYGYPPGKVKKNGTERPKGNVIDQVIAKQKQNRPYQRVLNVNLSVFLFLTVLVLTVVYIVYPKIFKRDLLEKLRSSGERVSIAVMPFKNMTNDTTWNVWQNGIQHGLISSLSNTGELKVRQEEYINTLLQTQGFDDYAGITPAIAGTVSKKLNADIFIYSIIQQAGPDIHIDAQLIDTKTKEVIKSFNIDRPSGEEDVFQIIDSLSSKVRNFLMISEIMIEHPRMQVYTYDFRSPEVLKYVIYGDEAKVRADYSTARNWYLKALAIDTGSFDANFGLWQTAGTKEDSLQIMLKLYKKRDQMPILDQLWTNWMYAISFEPPGEAIKCLEQIQVLDDQNPSIPLMKGNAYRTMNQYDKAIPLYKKSIVMFHEWGIKLDKAYAYLGETYHKTGQYKMEKRLYKKAERNNPDHSTISFSWIIRNQATLALSEEDTAAANKYIEKFISVLKENSSSEADILNGLALIHLGAGNLDKAEEYYNETISLEPENAHRINILANFLVSNNRHLGEVPGLTDKAMELAHDMVDYYNFLDTKGRGFYKQGKYPEALDILQRTWDSAPFPLYSLYSHLAEVKKAIAAQN